MARRTRRDKMRWRGYHLAHLLYPALDRYPNVMLLPGRQDLIA